MGFLLFTEQGMIKESTIGRPSIDHVLGNVKRD